MGKGENAGYQHFLLFPQCFLPILKTISIFELFILSSATGFNSDQSKTLLFGKGLRKSFHSWEGGIFYFSSATALRVAQR